MNSPTTAYSPLSIDLSGPSVLEVGGGKVAERKIARRLDAGAAVTVMSPRFTLSIAEWIKDKTISGCERPFRHGDLQEAVLVFAGTDVTQVNRAGVGEALERKILVNVVDPSAPGDFVVPAVFTAKEVMVSVSSHGKSPALSIQIRDRHKRLLDNDADNDPKGKTET